MTPTRKQIEAAKPEATIEMARHWIWTAAQMETAADDYVGYLTRPGGQTWEGATAEATQHRGGDDTKTANAAINALAESVMPALKNVRQLIENCEKLGGFTVHDDLSVTYEPPAGTSEERAQACRDACTRFSEQIKDAANAWWAADQHAGELIDRVAAALPANFNPLAGGGVLVGGLTQALGIIGTPKKLTPQENREVAFRNVFGRALVSPSDWATASMLDPHSYNTKNVGVPPEVRVAKIEPVPGQGVVRANWFIPSQEVLYPSERSGVGHNFGDNRGFNPKFAPEDARVSAIVDYENGVVVVRQNPSVETDTGRAMAGNPWASVSQDTNGAVKLYYNTADPWAPFGEMPSKLANYSVNGNIVVQPGAAGPSVGGQMTSFPAFEAYHDTPSGGTSQLAQVWPPGRADELGPVTGLPFMQHVGDQGILRSMDGARMTELMPPESRVPTVTPTVPPPPQTPVPRTEIGK